MARQIDAVAQRGGRLCPGRDDGKVEDRKRNHGITLMRPFGLTKGPAAQVRGAAAGKELATSRLLLNLFGRFARYDSLTRGVRLTDATAREWKEHNEPTRWFRDN